MERLSSPVDDPAARVANSRVDLLEVRAGARMLPFSGGSAELHLTCINTILHSLSVIIMDAFKHPDFPGGSKLREDEPVEWLKRTSIGPLDFRWHCWAAIT